jgi:DNA-binding response OmpR family regulator
MNVSIVYKNTTRASRISDLLKDVDSISLSEYVFEDVTSSLDIVRTEVVIFDITTSIGEYGDAHYIKALKTINPKLPILLATNSTETARYREMMLDAGVDGCIQLPFLTDELLLRLTKLIAKRDTLLFNGTTVSVHDVSVNLRDHHVTSNGVGIHLTKSEYSILFHLLLHKEYVVHSRDLMGCIEDKATSSTKSLTINTHIFNLRKKIGVENFIKTVPSYGFMINQGYKEA